MIPDHSNLSKQSQGEVTVGGCSDVAEAPKGLGRDGHKPLMQNRECIISTSPIDNTAPDNFMQAATPDRVVPVEIPPLNVSDSQRLTLRKNASCASFCAPISPSGDLNNNTSDRTPQSSSEPLSSDTHSIILDADEAHAHASDALCREFLRLKTEEHFSANQAASALHRSPAWFSVNFPRWQRLGLAAFRPQHRPLGARRRLFPDLPAWFVPVARFYWLISDLNWARGSIPEAIRCAISLPQCPPNVQRRLAKVCHDAGWRPVNGETLPTCPENIRQAALNRDKAGKPMLPESITRLIPASTPAVIQYRNPTDAGLDFLSSPGSLMWDYNDAGERTFVRSGDIFEPDDATINIPCCVPWTMRGCPCSERYGVKVGRFQFLLTIDVGSRKILGFTYTARPKSSYRGEDGVTLLRCIHRTSGIPRKWRTEKGVWVSKLINNVIETCGAGHIEVHSPHCKPFIEGVFNKLWTKLAIHFPDASVGRYMGQNEEANRLLTACQTGAQDPRKYFPSLAQVIQALEIVIAEHNESTIHSENWGQWVPNERWAADQAERPNHKTSPDDDWIFSPFMSTWKVQGNIVGGRVPIMDGVTVPFEFSAPWLSQYHGALVKAYFDPASASPFAKLCLAQPWANARAGQVLGDAQQVNETTGYIRLVMGWGDDAVDAGKMQRAAAATQMRREVRSIIPRRSAADLLRSDRSDRNDQSVYHLSEERNGMTTRKVELHKEETSQTTSTEAASRECGSPREAYDPIPQEPRTCVGDNHGTGIASRSDRKTADLEALKTFERDNKSLFL